MADTTQSHTTRLALGDFIAGVRILLLPVAVVAVLLAAGRLFHNPDAADHIPDAWLNRLPRETWAWVLLAYLAAIVPRRPVSSRMPGLKAKGLILILCGICFWLELDYQDTVAPLLRPVLAFALMAICALAAAAVAHTERMRRQQAAEERDRKLERVILDLEMQNAGFDPAATYPALFAELSSNLKTGSALGTNIWLLRPHPALDHRRPIDVLREPGGEARLLYASRLSLNGPDQITRGA